MSRTSPRDRLHDILEAIERYTSNGRDRYDSDELVRVWCVRHIEIIGEATSRLPTELRAAYPEVDWRNVVGMRNLVIHGYQEVSAEKVWSVVVADLPVLRRTIERMLAELPEE